VVPTGASFGHISTLAAGPRPASAELDAWPNEARPRVRLTAIRHSDASPLRRATGKTQSDIGFPTFDG
jgi:hypothetical protein